MDSHSRLSHRFHIYRDRRSAVVFFVAGCNAKPPPSARLVGFSVYACYAVMAVIYFVSGLSKLRESGLDWFRGENIEQKLVLDALEPIFLDYKWKASLWLVQHHAPDYIFAIIGT